MPVTTDKIDAMIAADLTREQMAKLLKAELETEERVRAEKRARAAAKKRRQRAELALEAFDDVPGTIGDIEGHEGTEGDDEGQSGTSGDIEVEAAKEAPQTPQENTNQTNTPSDPKGSSAPKGADRRRGHRIPDDFERSSEARHIAADFGYLGDDADEPLAEFCDYWRALPGVKGTKLDWPATLRNRLREVVRRNGRQQARASPTKRGSGNGYHDLLDQEYGPRSDDRPSAPHGDRLRVIAGARHKGVARPRVVLHQPLGRRS